MMRAAAILLVGLLAAMLPAQQQQQPESKPEQQESPKTPEAQPAPESQPAAEIEAPAAEKKLTLSLEAGNRWVQGIRGSQDVYRSVVNLGEGPRLFSAQAQYRDAQGKFADRVDVYGNSWGGDPYNTAHINADKTGVYSLVFDYRNVAYFNSLPSFADPLSSEGILLSERTFDIERRQIDSELRIKPGAMISPFIAYTFGDGNGRGVTTFVSDGNEFPVASDLDDRMNTVRGGVYLNFARFNVTLEQGHTSYSDHQTVFTADAGNTGNRRTPLLGTDLVLDQLLQTYRVAGDGAFSRAVIQGHPWSKLNFTGQFLYSQPSIDVNYSHEAFGDLFLMQSVTPYNSTIEQAVGDAKRPRTSGTWSTEFRIHPRLRITQSWLTDRFHVASGSVINRSFDNVSQADLASNSLLVLNYNQHEVSALFDVNRFLTLRGGHRYVWGDTEVPRSTLQLSPATGEVRRQVALAGAHLRAGSKFSATLDFEASPGDTTFFRTGLMNYQRGKARARYLLTSTLSVQGSFKILNNRNDQPGVDFDFRSRQTSFGLAWTPTSSRFQIVADYTRATLRSDIPIGVPPFYDQRNASYRDRGHHGSLFADLNLGHDIRVGLGGSFAVISGSQPTRYYQPQARLSVPVMHKLWWTSEWLWYGFSERLLAVEDFRTHIFSTGFRVEL